MSGYFEKTVDERTEEEKAQEARAKEIAEKERRATPHWLMRRTPSVSRTPVTADDSLTPEAKAKAREELEAKVKRLEAQLLEAVDAKDVEAEETATAELEAARAEMKAAAEEKRRSTPHYLMRKPSMTRALIAESEEAKAKRRDEIEKRKGEVEAEVEAEDKDGQVDGGVAPAATSGSQASDSANGARTPLKADKGRARTPKKGSERKKGGASPTSRVGALDKTNNKAKAKATSKAEGGARGKGTAVSKSEVAKVSKGPGPGPGPERTESEDLEAEEARDQVFDTEGESLM